MTDNSSRSAKPNPAPAASGNVFDWARGVGAGDLLASGLDRYLRRRRRRRVALATFAGAALLVTGVALLPFREAASTPPFSTRVAGVTILRPEHRTLPDGSTVDLNAGAEIEAEFTESLRHIVLHKGEAHFEVAKNTQRPFVVTAGTIKVRAVGTAFVVDLGTDSVDVLVTEGSVTVDTATHPTGTAGRANVPSALPRMAAALEAGGRLLIDYAISASESTAPRISELSTADMQTRLAWRIPRLKFAATPLAQVVTMFNEHAVAGRDPRLVLGPEVPANIRVSGMLRADDVDSLLRLLAGQYGISGEARAGEIVLRRP